MSIEDLSDTIVPRSDQLNADDLLAGPRAYTVAGVSRGEADQPITIALEGEGRAYKPCKSMRRVLLALWGADGRAWVGRRLELYTDPDVQWGGKKVGGLRIRSLSHLDRPATIALTVKRGQRVPYRVGVLADAAPPARPVPPLLDLLAGAKVSIEQADAWAESKGKPALSGLSREAAEKVAGWLWSDAGAAALEEMRATEVADA